jgi:hypothetical protein
MFRPLINLARRPGLPPPRKPLAFFYVAFISTDDVEAFRTLLRRVYADASEGGLRGGRYTHFTFGLHERDPRAAVLAEYRQSDFAGRLFCVTFDRPPELDGRVPYVEAALL